jgi:2-polyprenyl-3-methyl-5-hydroxy-6-metoxy-1,4-benzoquinol methylase
MENVEELSNEQIDELNLRCYDNQADRWNRFPMKEFLPPLSLKYHRSELGKSLLDIGSGVGTIAQWADDQGFDVLCLDPSSEMVKRTREKGLATLQTTIQDYNDKRSFAVVLAILSLHHMRRSDCRVQIEKIAGLIPSGGLFVMAMREGTAEEIIERESGFPRFFANYTEEELLEMTKPHFDLLDFRRTPSVTTNFKTNSITFILRKT